MKRSTSLLAAFGIAFGLVVGVLVVPNIAFQQAEIPNSPRCQAKAWQNLARADSPRTAFGSERECAKWDAANKEIVDVTWPQLELDLHPGESAITIRGRGFTPDSTLSVDIRVLADGVIGGPLTLVDRTDNRGHFTIASVSVACSEPHWSLYIVATDESGVAHAGRFPQRDLVCQSDP